MLLKLFSRPMEAKDMEAVRSMLMDYYEDLLQKEVARSIEQKGITRKDFEKVLTEQQRTQ